MPSGFAVLYTNAMRSNFPRSIATGVLFLMGLFFLSHAAMATPVACQPVLVTPCLVANNSGPYTITDPSQLTFQIVNLGSVIGGEDNSGNTAVYSNLVSGAQFAADPSQAVAANSAAVAALLASGATPISAGGGGGSTIVTNSNSTNITGAFVDTPFTQRVDQYQTTIQAILNGSTQVYQQTFALPFSDPAVQAAIAQANAILTGDGAPPGAPQLILNSTSQTGSQTTYTTTGQSETGEFIVSASQRFGPALVATGDNQSQLFPVISGQLDINVNTETFFATDRNVTATNTFLTTQTYEIDGATITGSPVPEPSTWALLGLGLCFVARRKQSR